jgi:membrane-associated protein
LVAGVGEMQYSKFLIYNIVGGFGWVVSMLLIGYTLGATIPGVMEHLELVIILVVFVSILPGIFKYLHTKVKKNP